MLKVQRTGAVQMNVAGFAVDTGRTKTAVSECQTAVSGQRHILFRIDDRQYRAALRDKLKIVFPDQIHGQLVLGNDHSVLIVRIGILPLRKRKRAAILQTEVFQRQRFGFNVIMPAVIIQITEIAVRDRRASDIYAVILRRGTEGSEVGSAGDALTEIELVFCIRGQTGDFGAADEMLAVQRNLNSADLVSVRILDADINRILAAVDFRVVCGNSPDRIAFAVDEIADDPVCAVLCIGDLIPECIIDAGDKCASDLRNAEHHIVRLSGKGAIIR